MTFSDGFSLIELAIVLIIIGFLMGYLLIPISAKKDQQYLKSTQKTLEEIKDALLGFAVREGRLPCADIDDDGVENPPCDTSITNVEGDLPWKDLKVGRYDVWGNPFRYRAAATFCTTGKTVGITNISSSTLRVRNLNNINWTSFGGVVAIIFSYGKNHKADNGNKVIDATYVHDGYVEYQNDPNKNFDDILTWLSRNTLMNRLTTAKRWPPPEEP